MKTRTVQLAGMGLAVLVLNSCGQKPAPAETLDSARPPQANKGPVQAMRVVRVEQRNVTDDIVASGRLVVREEAAVGSELPGYLVKSVYVDEGDWVKKGQPLAQLDDTLLQAQIAQAEATLETQKATVAFQQAQFERGQTLANEGAMSKEELDQRRMQAVSAKASLGASQAAVNEMKVRQSRMTLRAPVGGMILQRTLRPGDISAAVSTSGPYFRIARDGLIELDAELPDQKLAQLKEGDKATVNLPTGKSIEGKVRFISPRVDQNTSLGRARIELPFDKDLRPGSFAEAHLKGAASGALTVLAGAIRYESGGPVLMVVDNSNVVHRTPVKLGAHTGDYVQLLEGPASGSRVLAVGAAFTLDGDVIQPVEGEVAAAAPPATPGGK